MFNQNAMQIILFPFRGFEPAPAVIPSRKKNSLKVSGKTLGSPTAGLSLAGRSALRASLVRRACVLRPCLCSVRESLRGSYEPPINFLLIPPSRVSYKNFRGGSPSPCGVSLATTLSSPHFLLEKQGSSPLEQRSSQISQARLFPRGACCPLSQAPQKIL